MHPCPPIYALSKGKLTTLGLKARFFWFTPSSFLPTYFLKIYFLLINDLLPSA